MVRTITVKGIGHLAAKVDHVNIRMELETLNKDYEQAVQEATERIEKLREAVAGAGFAKEAVKTTRFHVEARYENAQDRQGRYTRVFAGYACCHDLKLSFDFDKKELARVLSAIAGSGAGTALQIEFMAKDPAKVSEELLTRAAQNAREKAAVLCRASGCKLGALLAIDYNWGELDIVSRTEYTPGDLAQFRMLQVAGGAPEIEPDDIDVTDTVAFRWELL